MHHAADRVDDLLNAVYRELLATGKPNAPTKGACSGITGAMLRLNNPRARLSLTEDRSVLFSALGEFLWYMSGSADVQDIAYYIPKYSKLTDDGTTVHGAYGPRFRRMDGQDQVRNVVGLLTRKPSSRRAVIQLFRATDLVRDYKDVPCTCTLQFLVREDKLEMVTFMRSNDAYLGLPHDIFALTMVQEFVAVGLGIDVGPYTHMVGDLHIYDTHRASAERYLDEGYQPISPMPSMPSGDQEEALTAVLFAESSIRSGTAVPTESALAPYWKDVISLLRIYSHFKRRDSSAAHLEKESLHTHVYDLFVDTKSYKIT